MLKLLHLHCLLVVAADEAWNILLNITQDLPKKIKEQLFYL
jgi:hypothetical protein